MNACANREAIQFHATNCDQLTMPRHFQLSGLAANNHAAIHLEMKHALKILGDAHVLPDLSPLDPRCDHLIACAWINSEKFCCAILKGC